MQNERNHDVTETDFAVLETNFGNEAQVEYVAYGCLGKSSLNTRVKLPTGLHGLADSIAAKGLLQNLVVHKIKGSRGKRLKFGVCAGQRRLAALDLLFSEGQIDERYSVPVKIVSEAEALAASLIENQQREPMHPADQCQAFKALIDDGKSIDYIAALFTVSPLMVKRRLKLADVSPKLIALFRDDQMSFEQISALALADDHEMQERLWFDATTWQRQPRTLRDTITQAEIDASRHRLAKFVGIEAYEAAGGIVRRDLFSDGDHLGFITNPELLYRLANENLQSIATEIQAEGWGWPCPNCFTSWTPRCYAWHLSR
jgi:ParB family transcriptional regulator, chromosome partitioning protein